MKLARSKKYKTNPKNPTGKAKCDRCGMAVNGNNLQKLMQYTGTPNPDYSFAAQYMQPGDVMGDGQLRWTGLMVCKTCVDVQNLQALYVAPKADPYPADGNRPMPNTLVYGNQVLADSTYGVFFTDEPDGEPIGI